MIRRLSKASPRLRRLMRRTRNAVIGAIADGGLSLIGRLSLDQALQLSERAGAVLYRVLRKSRRLAHEHLRLAFGDGLSAVGRERLAQASFINLVRSLCELAKIDEIRSRMDQYFEVDGLEHLQRLLDQRRGAIIVTGHIGNWELLAAYFAWKGFPVAAIARRG